MSAKTPSSPAFTSALRALNAEQKRAVDTLDGPVMVVAGPGTGKTQTIALRLANILQKTDANPDSLLALTFTESGARAVKERLASIIGVTAYYCHIHTFHGFCNEVIANNPDHFTLNSTAEPMSELEKLKLIYRLLDDLPVSLLRPVGAPRHYARAILGAISDLKREGVDPNEFSRLLLDEEKFLQSSEFSQLKKSVAIKRSRDLAKNRELSQIYLAYQHELDATHRFDFEDMINTVISAFKADEDLLRLYQERFQYFLVDEYQDTNNAQNELLLLLASYWGDRANVFVTGDPDQSIMRFQGASIENQLSFIQVFPQATVITLKINYRSTQTILDAADSLISHNNLRISDVVPKIDSHLVSQTGVGKPISLVNLRNSTDETIFLAEDIKKLLASGTSPSDIAIIYRHNRDASVISDTLIKYGLDYSVQGGANVLDDPTVRNFLKILRVIHALRTKDDNDDLFTILHYDIFHIDPLDILKISRTATKHRLDLFELLLDSSLLSSLILSSRSALDSAIQKLSTWQAFEATHTFTEFFAAVLDQSGYLKWVLTTPDAHHRLSRLNTLFAEVKRMNHSDHDLNLAGFIANLNLLEENHLRLDESDFGRNPSAITLTTAHSAKGLEWEHVYLYKSIDGSWGNNPVRNLLTLPSSLLKLTKLDNKEKNEDERRLFYVALTRAKSHLTLCSAQSYSSYGSTRVAVPSMFLSELGDSHLAKPNFPATKLEVSAHLKKLLSPPPPPNYSQAESTFLQELVDHFSLSVTALNTYLLCAYKFKLDKLLIVPHAKKPHLAFGTAVHRSLELFYAKLKDESILPSVDFLLSSFHTALSQEVITASDLSIRLKQGDQILRAYYDFHQNDFREPLFLEKKISVQLGKITLAGKIDRIEWLDQTARTIRVVDYKTGLGKTTGQILGETADSTGDLKRQLVFYKLLIDLDHNFHNFSFGEASLDFVETPLLKGKDGIRRFSITQSEVAELTQVIQDSMTEIRALHFPRTTNYRICTQCPFKDHCWPEGVPST